MEMRYCIRVNVEQIQLIQKLSKILWTFPQTCGIVGVTKEQEVTK